MTEFERNTLGQATSPLGVDVFLLGFWVFFLVALPEMEPDSNCINVTSTPGLPLGLLLSRFNGNGHA